MNDPVNALDLLHSQHEEVDTLLGELEEADAAADKLELFRELANNLAAHATIEEKLFYPAVNAKQTHEMLVESVEEHLQIKRLLADMMALDADDEHFDAKLHVLKEEVQHHAHEEEEEELFPKVRKLLSADELAALGGEMLAMFEALMQQEPRHRIPAETDRAAPV